MSSERERVRAAIALRYAEGDKAPVVAATGAGAVAQKILQAARREGIPIHPDPELVEAMARLRVGSVIPEALYAAVAQVLAWVYTVARRIQIEATAAEPRLRGEHPPR